MPAYRRRQGLTVAEVVEACSRADTEEQNAEEAALGCDVQADGQTVVGRHPESMTSSEAFVTAAIARFEDAVGASAAGPAALAVFLNRLGLGLQDRYERSGELSDLDVAIEAHRRALDIAPPGSSQLPGLRFNVGSTLDSRWLHTRSPADLDAAIDAYERAAVEAPDLPRVLNNIGNRLENRYRLTGSMRDLKAAIDALRQAVESTDVDSPELPGRLSNLAVALQSRYERIHSDSDLHAAIDALQRAVGAAAPGSSYLHAFLSNLGLALQHRYEHSGALSDLDAAIAAFERAVGMAPPADMLEVFNNLGRGLRRRFERTGELSALDAAIGAFQRAVDAAPRDWWNLSVLLHNLGVCLGRRFESRGSRQDLDMAIDALRAAVKPLPPGAAVLSAFLSDLGTWLRLRFDRYGAQSDLEAAIAALEAAIADATPGSIDFRAASSNLGRSLLSRSQRTGAASDLSGAISALQRAADATPANSPDLPIVLCTLGDGFRERFERTGAVGDRDAAVNAYRGGCGAGLDASPDAALGGAVSWGHWSAERGAWEEASEACRLGLEAAAALHKAQLMRADKQVWLRAAKNVAAAAAYAEARLGHRQDAVLAIEQGRALLLSEALERDRADLESLRERGRSDLLNRYEQTTAGLRELECNQLDAGQSDSAQTQIQEFRAVRSAFDAVIAEIRTVKDMGEFLAPPTFRDIAVVASESPLAYLLSTPSGGLALIVRTTGQIAPLWLPELTHGEIRTRTTAYLTAYKSVRRERQPRWSEALDELTAWLWRVAMGPLLEATSDIDRLVLVPVGLLGILPLHAAWTHDSATPTGRRYALDETELTYAPNARALRACQQAAKRITPDSLLAVGDTASLEHAHAELDAARRGFASCTFLEGAHATPNDVLAALVRHSVLHFACHGSANLDEPLSSALHLPVGKQLTLRQVMTQRLTRTRLAVLSACETALPGTGLPDEAISLPSGFIQAGASGVVASLWNVPDLATMMLMTRFYELWREGGRPPAAALREAQRWLRDSTNGEKASRFPVMADLAREHLPLEMRAEWETRRDLQGPDHWAAFTYAGA